MRADARLAVSLRPMADTTADYAALQRWFHEPELQEWVWCDEKGEPPVSLERVREKYGPRVTHPTDVFPWFILRDGQPIGFIQYYFQQADRVGLAMWIGEKAARNHGFGAEALRQMVQIIHRQHPEVRTLFIDPETGNLRAIHCYQRAGFQPVTEVLDETGARCLLLERVSTD